MGTNKRYAAQIDERMNARIVERTIAQTDPETLLPEELELDDRALTKPPRAVPCSAWVRYNGTPLRVDAEAVAWTDAAVAIRWKLPSGTVHRAWVWSSAVSSQVRR